jgi:hypothetical protein
VLERIAGAIDAGPLPYHMAVTPSTVRLGSERHALRAQAGRGRQVLVDRRQELHLRFGEELLGSLPQLLVDHAQRAAAVAGDEGRGVQARRPGRGGAASAAGAPAPACR